MKSHNELEELVDVSYKLLKKSEYRSLLKKDLFNNYMYRRSRIDCIDLKDSDRNFIVKTILQAKLSAMIINMLELIKKCEQNDYLSLESEFVKMIEKTVDMYENDSISFFTERYGMSYGLKIWHLVYSRKNAFANMHEKNINYIMVFIDVQNHSELDVNMKLSTFIDMSLTAFKLAFFDLEKLMRELNGELTKLIAEAYENKYAR